MRILLIEPDKMLSEVYRRTFEGAGYAVSVCPLAQIAIGSADQQRPDIVVMELQLVGHSGVEFLYEFRSYVDWQNIPLILLTYVPIGEFAGCQRLLYEDLSVARYLYKPQTSLRKLLRSVHELVIT